MANMKWKRFLMRTVGELASFLSTTNMPRHGYRILMYHAVGTPLVYDKDGIFSIKPWAFKEHMELLASYIEVMVLDLTNQVSRNDSSLKVSITFDDGYKDNLYNAAPILLKYGMPFTVFISPCFLKEPGHVHMTPSELRELASMPNVTIGSHGMNHSSLTECDNSTLKEELSSSKKYLEDCLGKEVKAIAYPYGEVNRRVRASAEEAGYTIGVCSRFGINDNLRDPLLLCRTEIAGPDSGRVFLQKLCGNWDWYSWRRKDPALIY